MLVKAQSDSKPSLIRASFRASLEKIRQKALVEQSTIRALAPALRSGCPHKSAIYASLACSWAVMKTLYPGRVFWRCSVGNAAKTTDERDASECTSKEDILASAVELIVQEVCPEALGKSRLPIAEFLVDFSFSNYTLRE